MDKHQTHRCDFCNKTKEQVEKLILGDNASICNECVKLCSGMLDDDKIKRFPSNENKIKYNPVKIKEYLDQYIISQEHAKMVLSVAVCQHHKRIYNPVKKIQVDKSNILLIGPTGCGKTELIKQLSCYLDLPFAICDATTLTESGYVGDDVDSILLRLLSAANYDLKLAEQGIIYIDEIDKISRKTSSNTSTRDVGGEGVQQALLKIIEGTVVSLPANYGKKTGNSEVIEFDTKNILFICGGAFVGLTELISSRLHSTSSRMGFGAVLSDNINNIFDKITPKDLILYGLIPEFIGRFSMITHVELLNCNQLIRILKEPKNNLISQYQYLFELDGIELKFENEALELIAQQAVEQGTNARGLKSIIEAILLPYQFDAIELKERNLTQLIITKNTVSGGPAKMNFKAR